MFLFREKNHLEWILQPSILFRTWDYMDESIHITLVIQNHVVKGDLLSPFHSSVAFFANIQVGVSSRLINSSDSYCELITS